MRGLIVLVGFFLLNCLNVASAFQSANAPVGQSAHSASQLTTALVAE